MSFSGNQRWNTQQAFFNTPVTLTIIGLWAVVLVMWQAGPTLTQYLAFTPHGLQAVTGIFTYPLLINPDLFWALLTGVSFFWVGGSLERSWGWRAYSIFLLGVNTSCLLLVEMGGMLMQGGHLIDYYATPWGMILGCMVAWSLLNPGAVVMFFFIIPMPGRGLTWGTLVLAYFILFSRGPGLFWFAWGFFGLGGLGFAFLFVHNGWARGVSWTTRGTSRLRHPRSSIWSGVQHQFKEWQRRRRAAQLKRMFGDFDDRRR
jgi:hypothetical protein